jgi:hypothetical protein
VPITSDSVSQAWEQLLRRKTWRSNQSSVRKRDTHQRGLRSADHFSLLARRLITGLAIRTCVVESEERPDDKLARLDGLHRTFDLLDNAAVFVAHRSGFRYRVDAAVGPQVRPTDAGHRGPDNGVGRLNDLRLVALPYSNVTARTEQLLASSISCSTKFQRYVIRSSSSG